MAELLVYDLNVDEIRLHIIKTDERGYACEV